MGKHSRKGKNIAHVRKSPLPQVFLKIKEEIDQGISAEASNGCDEKICLILSDLRHFYQHDTGAMLRRLKQISCDHNSGKSVLPDMVIKMLVGYLIIEDPGSQLSKACIGNLDGIKQHNIREKAKDVLCHCLRRLLNETISQSSTNTGSYVIDLFTSCLISSPLGVDVMQAEMHHVLGFLAWFLDTILSSKNTSDGDDIEKDLCSVLKCAAAVLKKCMDPETSSIREFLEKILSLCKTVLSTDTFGWNSHNAAGMAWIMTLKASYNGQTFLSKAASVVSDLEELLMQSVDGDGSHITEFAHINEALSFCSGIMLTLTTADLIKKIEDKDHQKCLILDYILPCVRFVEKQCTTISQGVVVAKCYAKWTCIVLDSFRLDPPPFTKMSLMGEEKGSDVILYLTHYAFDKLEHPIDAIRHQANEILVNLLGIAENLGIPNFSHNLLDKVLSQNWQKRSTFTALNCILHYVPIDSIFETSPDIVHQLLNAMKQQSLAPYASETYKILAVKTGNQNNTEPNEGTNSQENFALLSDPMLEAMCRSNAHSLRLLIDYGFIKVLKVFKENGLEYILDALKSKLLSNTHDSYMEGNTPVLAVFLSCLKSAILNGYVKDNSLSVMYGDDYRNLLRSSMLHEDSEIRHIGLALLCESAKPSNFVQTSTLDMLKYTLTFNVSCQDPAFRQRLTNSLKKLFLQVRGNMLNLKKTQEKVNVKINDLRPERLLNAYEEFIIWLGEFTTSQLHPTAPYPKRITCITVLATIITVFFDADRSFTVDFSSVFTHHVIQSLFVLLSDPYDDVKQISFGLLGNSNLRGFIKSYTSQDWLDKMLTDALKRACVCSKPEWCGDAAYHLKLYCVLSENQSLDESVLLRLCQNLLKHLTDSADLAEKNLYLAATTSPMYGLLHCLKCLLQSTDFREENIGNIPLWRCLVHSSIDVCFHVSSAVLPVVGSVSPEGHLPDVQEQATDEVTGGADDAWNELPDVLKSLILGGNGKEEQDERKTRALAQQVLVCCWRSAKESSLLLQEVTSNKFPLDSSKDSNDGVLSWDKFLNIGEHLRKQLMEARHRGAFEIAYYAFKAYCTRIWNVKLSELNLLPRIWLESSLHDIKDPTRSKDLCATRRSAGLPFLMQALLGTNKSAEGKRHLHSVMTTLLHLCQSEAPSIVSMVHALNVLRGLVKDASLGEEILPYVSECMQVSLSGFNSPLWAVRNSSTLLFSALFTRIFGVKRDKNDDLALKNRLSGNEFFSRLPGLHSFLVKRLEEICVNLDRGGHHALCPTLHPILLLMSRIHPSTMQPTAGIALDEFAPLLIRCRASAVYKSRVAAATALASILSWDQRLAVMRKCCENLSTDVASVCGKLVQDKPTASSPQNRIHGGLLQIGEIIRCVSGKDQDSSGGLLEVLAAVRRAFIDVMPFLGTRLNKCPLTRAASLNVFLQISDSASFSHGGYDEGRWQKLSDMIVSSCIDELESENPAQPSQSFLDEACAKIAILLPQRPSITVLATKSRDSFAAVLNILSLHWEATERRLSSKDLRALEVQLTNIILRNSHNDEIATSIYRVLSKITSSVSVDQLFDQSLEVAKSCDAAQSSLLEALVAFQSSCMMIVSKMACVSLPLSVFGSWIDVLSSASRCFENTVGVRLAVANSLYQNSLLLYDHEELLGDGVVGLWRTLIDLLCDEESEVRKMASYVTYEVSRKSDFSFHKKDHPCVDNLALIHAVLTLISAQGRKNFGSCYRTLQILAMSEPRTIPATSEDVEIDRKGSAEEFLSGLFEKSETNAYLDTREVTRIAKICLDVLEDINGSLELKIASLIKKFEFTSGEE